MASTIKGEVGKGASLDECAWELGWDGGGRRVSYYTRTLLSDISLPLEATNRLDSLRITTGSWLQPVVLNHCRFVA